MHNFGWGFRVPCGIMRWWCSFPHHFQECILRFAGWGYLRVLRCIFWLGSWTDFARHPYGHQFALLSQPHKRKKNLCPTCFSLLSFFFVWISFLFYFGWLLHAIQPIPLPEGRSAGCEFARNLPYRTAAVFQTVKRAQEHPVLMGEREREKKMIENSVFGEVSFVCFSTRPNYNNNIDHTNCEVFHDFVIVDVVVVVGSCVGVRIYFIRWVGVLKDTRAWNGRQWNC